MEYDTELECWTIFEKTYIKTLFNKIKKLFDIKLKNYISPMEIGDHPDMDESELLDQEQIAQYKMLIGSVQWVVTLGQYYVQYATNIMARFAQHPIEGHINRAFMVFGYLEHHI